MELKYKSAAVEIEMDSWNRDNAVGMEVGLLETKRIRLRWTRSVLA
ncbi:hypothetical protein [Sphingobacterium sp. UBA3549]|nr:hypothetical protein [Sphingobacterium sp. UBA3549]